MCAKQGIFRCNFVNTLITFVIRLANRLVNSSHFCQFFEVVIHFLIGNNGQHFVIFKRHILVLVKNRFAVVVQLDNQAIGSLDRCNLNVVVFNITSAEVKHIGITQARESLEEEYITHTFENLLVGRDFELSETVEFVPSEKDVSFCTLEFRLITIIGVVLMHTFLVSPAQKPF